MNKKEKTFEQKVIEKSLVPDLVAALVIFTYIFIPAKVTSQLPLSRFVLFIAICFVMVMLMQFVIAPFVDHLIYRGLSSKIIYFEKNETDDQQRTKLFEDLMQIPVICALQTFLYFVAGSIVAFFLLRNLIGISTQVSVLSLVEALCGSVLASLYAYSYCRGISTEYACDIVQEGISPNYALKKKVFGLSLSRQLFFFVILPFLLTVLIQNLVLLTGYYNFNGFQFRRTTSSEIQIELMALTCILNTVAEIILSFVFFTKTFKSNQKLTDILEILNDNETTEASYIPTDLNDEIAYNHYLANNMLMLFNHTLNEFENIGKSINESAQSLYAISAETSTTSLQQSAGTKEIVETMKGTTSLSGQIEESIVEVSQLAAYASDEVKQGNDILKMYTEKMSEVERSNLETIEGIKNLNGKINTVWEIVNLITSFTDQTKIIAFNAELEATKLSDSTSSFKNISNEVRRLANRTMESARQIKAKISEIQLASDLLIKASMKCTEQIHLGLRLSDKLNNNFSNISYSSQTNSSSADDIKELIMEQSTSFNQIEKTLEQINSSIQEFTYSTQILINTAQTLKTNSESLEKVNATGDKNEEQ